MVDPYHEDNDTGRGSASADEKGTPFKSGAVPATVRSIYLPSILLPLCRRRRDGKAAQAREQARRPATPDPMPSSFRDKRTDEMRPISIINLLYWLLLPLSVIAQARDTLLLPEVHITDVRLGRPDSMMSYRITRIPIQHTLAGLTLGDVISRQGAGIRGYGPGVLQTVAFRGFAASQTQVLWNGWALNHGMVGVTDLSLYPAFLMSDVIIHKGGGSSDYGNAAIGGVIELNQAASGQTDLHSGIGSGQSITLGAKTSSHRNGWDVAAGVFHRRAENDYLYEDVFRFPITERKRENAANELISMMLSFRKEERDRIQRFATWMTEADSDIPGPISAGTSRATQKDRILRQTFGLSQRFGRSWLGTDATMSVQQLDYLDPDKNEASQSDILMGGLRLYWIIPGLRVQAEGRGTTVTFTEYDPPNRYETSLSATVVGGNATGSARIDHDTFFGAFWSGSLGYRMNPIRANVARSFGVPTFNDLYWPVLGNPDLKPETANKAEIGLFGTLFSVDVNIPLFMARITDGIQWIPQTDGRVRPMNLRDVTTFGAEPSLRHRRTWNGVGVDSRIEASYIRARYTKSRFSGDRSVNKRVAYVPEWQSVAEMNLTWNGWSFMPSYRFTGERFTTEDERFPMPAFGLWEFSAAYTKTLQGITTTMLYRMDNAMDVDYSLIRWYPMPGRQHTFTLHITFL